MKCGKRFGLKCIASTFMPIETQAEVLLLKDSLLIVADTITKKLDAKQQEKVKITELLDNETTDSAQYAI
jgi:hypothetical protein